MLPSRCYSTLISGNKIRKNKSGVKHKIVVPNQTHSHSHTQRHLTYTNTYIKMLIKHIPLKGRP